MRKKLFAWLIFILAAVYFVVPLIATFEFSLRINRGTYSFDAYRKVFADPTFRETFSYSVIMSLLTILFGVLLIVPTAYWVRLRLPRYRPLLEFVTLLPLVLPPIVLVFGYIRLYNTSSFLPMTGSITSTNLLLLFGYATISLPYMYRAIDTGMATIDINTLTEAALSLGASWATIIFRIILPNVIVAVLSGAFLTFAMVMGEFVLAALLSRPAFGPYMQLLGANRAYEPAALAVIAFLLTWTSMALIQLISRFQKHKKGEL